MRAVEIENWALRVLDRVQQGLPIEDSRVELKTTWINPSHAARRIAGHCNASAGDRILWLIGVDENKGITGTNHHDMASWWPEVAAQFDGLPPAIQELVVTHGDYVVVALVFETDRVPFVVRNPAHGKQGGGGGPVEREVPWREGTSVRSAKHSDLIRLLVPVADLPRLELQKATAELSENRHNSTIRLIVTITVYAVVPLGAAIALPDHQANGSYYIPDRNLTGQLEVDLGAKTDWPISSLFVRDPSPADSRTHTVHQGDEQILITGPGFFRFICDADMSETEIKNDWDSVGPLEISLETRPAGSDLAATVHARLTPYFKPAEREIDQPTHGWRLADDHTHYNH